MKQRTFLLIAVILGVFAFSFFHFRVQAQETLRTVRVGTYENPPKIYTDTDGSTAGVFADILSIVALRENWNIEYVSGTFEEGLERVRTGEIDLMVDVAVDEERLEEFEFTNETALSSWGVVYVRNGSMIDSIQDLDGKKIAILNSSVYLDGPGGMKQFAGAFHLRLTYVGAEEYDEVFTMLSSGEVDAAIVSRISGLTAEKNYTNVRPTEIIFKPTELRFALTKDDPDSVYLIERLDHWVMQLRDGYQGLYRDILEQHDLLGLMPNEQSSRWMSWLSVSAAIAMFISWAITILFSILYWRARMRLRQYQSGSIRKRKRS